jgi:predicted O-methyltransferase YrrM
MLTVRDILLQRCDFDVAEVCCADDPCVLSIGLERLRSIYRVKHQVARAVGAGAFLEFGVRTGYAAAAFLAAKPAGRYVGLGRDDGSHGRVVGYPAAARTMLWQRYPDAWVEVYPWDSGDAAVARRLRAHEAGAFDLVHIDGDHTEGGCVRDLELAAELVRPGGHLLVDDYDLLGEVRRAVDQFLARRGAAYQSLYVPSPHGDLLIRAPGGGQPLQTAAALTGYDCLDLIA